MKLVYQYMAIFFNFSPTLNHLHPLQVENCDSNSRLVVDEDGNGKFRLERVNINAVCYVVMVVICIDLLSIYMIYLGYYLIIAVKKVVLSDLHLFSKLIAKN